MPLGASTFAPSGFLDFCFRSPEACEVSPGRAEAENAVTRQIGGQATRAVLLQTLAGPRDSNALIRTALAMQISGSAPTPTVDLDYQALSSQAAPDAPQAVSPPDELVLTMAQALASPPRRNPSPGQLPQLASAQWKQVKAINAQVNRAIYRSTDLQTYGREEVWALPLQSGVTYGDCEDYALEKRRALLEAGFDHKNLNIAVVTTWAGERHAVLLVRAAEGEFVLDNLTSRVLPWNKAGYDWDERQVDGGTFDWVVVSQPPSKHSAPVRRDQLIAALQ